MRLFDLDGSGKKMWEWVGPNEGVLFWNESGSSTHQPTAYDFFGFDTWGQKWDDGLAALVSLDVNKDRQLSGNELESIWVWQDRNSDAVSQVGELDSLLSRGITSLNIGFQPDGMGGVWMPTGAKDESGAQSHWLSGGR